MGRNFEIGTADRVWHECLSIFTIPGRALK